jgi:hypothetical protein
LRNYNLILSYRTAVKTLEKKIKDSEEFKCFTILLEISDKMTRLLIGSLLDTEKVNVTERLAGEIQGCIGKYLEKNGASILCYANESDEFSGGKKRNLQIDGLGNFDLYTTWINSPSNHAYLSNETLISGAQTLWGLDSPTVRDIKKIFKEFHMLLERDELKTEQGTLYVDDAIFSRFMKRKNNNLLFHEDS